MRYNIWIQIRITKNDWNNDSTEIELKVNTGIIIGYGIEEAINLILENPTGRVIG